MTNYFYGLAANPYTAAHHKIITDILESDEINKVFVAITEHDYKNIDMPWDLRNEVVEANLSKWISEERVQIVKQMKRTYEFLTQVMWEKIDYIVIGEDEWEDLKAGKWHFSQMLLDGWKFKVIPRGPDSISSTKVREMLREGASSSDMKDLISEQTYDLCKPFFRKKTVVF